MFNSARLLRFAAFICVALALLTAGKWAVPSDQGTILILVNRSNSEIIVKMKHLDEYPGDTVKPKGVKLTLDWITPIPDKYEIVCHPIDDANRREIAEGFPEVRSGIAFIDVNMKGRIDNTVISSVH